MITGRTSDRDAVGLGLFHPPTLTTLAVHTASNESCNAVVRTILLGSDERSTRVRLPIKGH